MGRPDLERSQYDVAGRRIRLTWNDGFYVTYDYDNLGAMTAVRENGGTALASYGYDGFGRRTSIAYGNGTQTTYAYDGASRLSGLSHDLAGGSYDQSYGFAYNPAGQITSRTASNDAYAFTGNASADRSYATNGLNQYTQSGGVSLGYDARGNLTQSGSDSYSYTTENHLASSAASGQRAATSLYHDPLDRLYAITSSQTIFDYDGADLVLETDQSTGTQVKARYVYGADETPVVWYPQASTDGKRYLYADERGSVVALVDASGNALQFDSYSPYGIPAGSNTGRFQYTGQKWIAELGMYDYKARIYSPTLGRFLQTDPIGYGDGLNWYNYAGSDPVNFIDPSGLCGADLVLYNADGSPCEFTVAKKSNTVSDGGGGDQPYFSPQLGGSGANPGGFGGGLRASPLLKPQNKHFYCGLFRNGSGVATAGGSASGSVQLPGNVRLGGSVSAGIALDGNFNVAGYVTYGGGPSTAGTGGAVGVTLGASNSARSVNDLGGFFSNISGQIGNVVGSYFSGYGASSNSVNGAEVTIGAGAGASGSAGGSNTILSKPVNLKNLVGC